MATLNKVMLMGRVCMDPEPTKTLPNGSTVGKFRLAVGRSKKNAATGQWENDPHPLYIDCEAFHRADEKRDLPNVIAQYVKKGDPLYVEGRLVLDEWDDKNGGGKRSKHKLVVDQIEMLGTAGGRTDGAGGASGKGAKMPQEDDGGGTPVDYGNDNGSSIPF